MEKNSRTNWDTVLKANKVLKFLVMIEKFINIYTDSIDITCVLFKSLDAFGPWNLNLIATETKCLFQSIDWRENLHLPSSTIIYHHLPSSTYIWGWKIWFLSKFPLNKYNDWKHRRLFRKTQDQSRSAAWGLLGSLPEKKTQRHVAMWVLYGENLSSLDRPLNGGQYPCSWLWDPPQKRYLPRFLLRWNLVKPSILFFKCIYIYVCVCSVCVCIRFASLCLCSIFWTAAVSGSVSQLSHRPSFSGRRHLETWKHIVK
jgi:hypothetical protein